jgi:hypothetical protein
MVAMTLNTELIALGILLLAVLALFDARTNGVAFVKRQRRLAAGASSFPASRCRHALAFRFGIGTTLAPVLPSSASAMRAETLLATASSASSGM